MERFDGDLTFLLDKKPTEILEHFRDLGIVLDKDWNDVMAMFTKQAFFISNVNKANLLIIAKKIIEDAISKGTDLKEFKNKIANELKLADWHASIVVTQNINNAYNNGRYKLQMDTKERFPFMIPIVTLDNKTTDRCQWLVSDGICFKSDDPNLYKVYPPRHFRCRTIFVTLTENKKEKEGYKTINVNNVPTDKLNDIKFRRKPLTLFKPDISNFPNTLVNKLKKILK